MRAPEITHDTRDGRIIAPPPFDPKHGPKQPLLVSRTHVCIGLSLLISGFGIGSSSSFFPAVKLWLGGLGLLLIVSSSSFSACIVYARDEMIRENCLETNASNQSLDSTADRRDAHI
jgi:hypothetical protein